LSLLLRPELRGKFKIAIRQKIFVSLKIENLMVLNFARKSEPGEKPVGLASR